MFDYEAYYKSYNCLIEAKYEELTAFLRQFVSQVPAAREKGFRQRMSAYAQAEGQYLLNLVEIEARMSPDYLKTASVDELKKNISLLYSDILPDHYAQSNANPSYAVTIGGKELGQVLALYAHVFRDGIDDSLKHRRFLLVKRLELYFELRRQLLHGQVRAEALKNTLHRFVTENLSLLMQIRLHDMFDPNQNEAAEIILHQDPKDPGYLYEFSLPVTGQDEAYEQFFRSMDESRLRAIASHYVESIQRNMRIDKFADGPRTCCLIRVPLGCELLGKALSEECAARGMGSRITVYSSCLETSAYLRDHRFAPACLLEDRDLSAYQSACRKAADNLQNALKGLAGRICVVPYESRKDRTTSDMGLWGDLNTMLRTDYFHQILRRAVVSAGQLYKTADLSMYIPSMIADPSSLLQDESARADFSQSFDLLEDLQISPETVPDRPMTAITDAMDYGEFLYIKGRDGNETDLTIAIPVQENSRSQSGALISRGRGVLPSGYVGTVPVLSGTNGTLHVASARLQDREVSDLRLSVQDGLIVSATFTDEDGVAQDFDLSSLKDLSLSRVRLGLNFSLESKIAENDPSSVPEEIRKQPCLSVTLGIRPEKSSTDYEYFEPLTHKHVRITSPDSYGEFTVSVPYSTISRLAVIHSNGSSVDILREGMFVLIGTDHLNVGIMNLQRKALSEETQKQSPENAAKEQPAASTQPPAPDGPLPSAEPSAHSGPSASEEPSVPDEP